MSKKLEKTSGKASPKVTKALATAVAIASKVMEVGNWIVVVGMIITAIYGFTGGAFLGGHEGEVAEGLAGMDVYGFSAMLTDGTNINYGVLGIFSIGSAVIAVLMAMVFRNIHLITKNSQKKTPFTEDNVRMVKEIGIFFIAAPLTAAVFAAVIELGTDTEAFANVNTFLPGIIMLYLTQVFAHGVELEGKK